ncbi:CBR-ZYX-1 protein, partial [Loa loa]
SPKPTTPRLDAETLQHAVAGLRKTEHGRSLQGDIENLSNGRLDGTDQQLSRRHWPNSSFDVTLEGNQTGATFHASSNDTCVPMPVRNIYRNSDALNNTLYTERSPFQQQSQTMPFSSYHSNHQQSRTTPFSSYHSNQQQSQTTSFPSYHSNQQQYSFSQYQSSNETIPNEIPYITNPKSYIRAYATQTPAYTVMDVPGDAYQGVNNNYHNTGRHVPYSNINKSYQFVKDLRDQSLTKTQRIANQFQQSQLRDLPAPQSMGSIYEQKERLGRDQIDLLIRDMEWKLRTGAEDKCCKCGGSISNDRPGCTAIGEMFHITCFTCKECNKQLAGGSFYNVDGQPLCEDDYVKSLEKCGNCGKPITEKLLRATGSAYHPDCFVCTVCKKCLDGVPFTVDSTNKVHCVVCFHEKFAPRCAVCLKPIVPEEGQEESVRVVAMDKSFHVNCYRCEDCNIQLSSKIEGQG